MDSQKRAKKRAKKERRSKLMKEKQCPLPSQLIMLEGVTLPSPYRAANEVKIRPTLRDLESDMAVRSLYDRWCVHYNINRTAEEMDRRFDIFKKNVFHVSKMNKIVDSSCQFHLSSFCDEKDLFDWSGDEEMTLTPTQQDVASEEAVWDLYYRWCFYHEILRTPEEMQQRFNNFKTIAVYAVRKMKKDPSCNFPLSDWCDKIQLHYLCGGEEMGLTPTKGDLESEEALMDLYCRWCFHHKIDRTRDEMRLAFKSFQKCATWAFKKSQEDPTVQFCLSEWCDETEHHPVYAVKTIPTERDLESGNALLGLYHRFCRAHEIHRTPEEMQVRFNDFKNNAFRVFEKNKLAPKVPRNTFPCCLFCVSRYCDEKDPLVWAVVVCLRPTFRDLASHEAVMALYKRWCLNQNISRTPEEMNERFHIFRKEAQCVFDDNIEYQGSCALTVFCDEEMDWDPLDFSSDEE